MKMMTLPMKKMISLKKTILKMTSLMMKVKMAMPQAERSAEDAAQLKAAFKSIAELQPTRGKSETPPRCGGADVDAARRACAY